MFWIYFSIITVVHYFVNKKYCHFIKSLYNVNC